MTNKINFDNINKQIEKMNMKINKMYLLINKKEDDLKNAINEKDILINEMKEKILKQEKQISNLNKYINKIIEESQEKEKQIEKNNKDLEEVSCKYKQLNDKINKKENYIILKLLIDKKDIKRDIVFLRQYKSHKYHFNFEPDDISILVNNKNIPIKYKCPFEFGSIISNDNNDEDIKNIAREFNKKYYFYYNFSKEGKYKIKIIFNKNLMTCEEMFYDCNHIIEIDCSHFNCSNVASCKSMFSKCSLLEKINFGLLDFSFCSTYESMFYNCRKLNQLDVSNFNTKNSQSFKYMFYNCSNLEKIDVSKFDSSKCENIIGMFLNCNKINEINMINWNMKNIKEQINDNFDYKNSGIPLYLLGSNLLTNILVSGLGIVAIGAAAIYGKYKRSQIPKTISGIDRLFFGCQNLKQIKMNTNINNINGELNYTTAFCGISENGSFIWKSGSRCDAILDKLPSNWNKGEENI